MWQQLLVTIRWSGQTQWKNPLSKYFEALLEPVSNGLMLPFGAKDDFTHAPPLWCEPYLTKVLPGVKIQTPLIVPRKNAINCTFGKMDVWDVGLKISAIQLHCNVPGCSVWLLSAAKAGDAASETGGQSKTYFSTRFFLGFIIFHHPQQNHEEMLVCSTERRLIWLNVIYLSIYLYLI